MNRVVITGLGVVAPNGNNVSSFLRSLRTGGRGNLFVQHCKDSAMGCCVAGYPRDFDEKITGSLFIAWCL